MLPLYYYGYGFYFDPTYFLVIIALLISLGASALVRGRFAKYSKMPSKNGLTGAEAARRVLDNAGLFDVAIERVQGSLTDHYDPRKNVLRLSDSTYASSSVAAVAVAAHECGHAMQRQQRYRPLVLRSTLVPVSNFGSIAAWPVFILGLIMSFQPLVLAGIILFSLAVLFQLITLPVEFNASKRAMAALENGGILSSDELFAGKKVLSAAALTYVAALAASLLQLLRLVLLARRNSD